MRLDTTELTVLAKQCEQWSGWQIAEELGLSYSGDMNPVDHGGIFYESRNWLPYGYASVVELYPLEDGREERLLVSSGTIHRPDDGGEMLDALDCIGMRKEWEAMWEDPNNGSIVHLEIDACRAYRGIEPSDYHEDKTYKVATWRKEWRLWRSILPLLLSLQEG